MLILASQSPRRRELLSLITEDFEVIPAKGEERADRSLPPDKYVCELARHKAEEVAAAHPGAVVIGADTVVSAGGQILGKPADADDAQRMLRLLSGTEHSVFTGVCVISAGGQQVFCCETRVRFDELDDREIADYIASGEPFDKAGAYGIQGRGALLVGSISGDYYNVMGLPVNMLYRRLKKICPELM